LIPRFRTASRLAFGDREAAARSAGLDAVLNLGKTGLHAIDGGI
jgi:hypothetical protein